ncbi:LuxR C-terminal-related transcriptional regulator [Ectopseudomonas alcaliphila]|uniref:LuxR C-terminal-related transcriptional regulator n=1 Tax=Ectopseudomonas alcaliphila TaxID=101564 RepID=UPI0027809CD2|nr:MULTISPECIES: LuxR C-terminal-related transcriptional regulator [Pseudomonas]MDP9940239.1 DNA-binding CsgD family transcriptional regulator [Pseudomonas sp. 3400]MDR7012195.1 DNA-binding CsgD family transcriptional regulator [Pseudomonas alcaliphila]
MPSASLLLPVAPLPLAEPMAFSLADLTEREGQTLALIAAGLNNKRIARELGISDGTVKIYVRNLLRKFRLNSRLELATWVHRNGSDLPSTARQALDTAALPRPAATTRVPDLLDELPGLIYRGYNDRTWYMEFVSAGCLPLTGYPAEYLTSSRAHSFGSLILGEYADYVWYCVQCALLKHEPYQLSYRIRCSDGQIKDVWEKGVGIYSATGEVLGVEGAIFEVRG